MFNPPDPRRTMMFGGDDRLILEYELDVEITLWQQRGDDFAVEYRRFGSRTFIEVPAPFGLTISVLRRIALQIDPRASSPVVYPELTYLWAGCRCHVK